MKKFFIKFLAVLNAAEGIIHLTVSGVSFYGMYDLGVWDWRIMTAPATDLVLGVFSLVTGYFLHQMGHHHHH